jgi:SPP1 gp7 family putative phage head morphogenesis protein
MGAYSRRLSDVYRSEIRSAVAEVLGRADASIRSAGRDIELTAEQAALLVSALRRAIRRARRRAEGVEVPERQVQSVIRAQAAQGSRAERRYLRALGADPRRLAMALSVPPDRLMGVDIAPSLAEQEAIAERTADALSLIRAEAGRMAVGYEGAISRAVREGARWETIARDLTARTGMDYRHARLIARDQTNKLNASIAEATQAAAGIDRYIWRATPDGLVRDTHADADGLVVAWSSPGVPDVGPYGEAAHAGQPIQCRCQAEAVIPPGLRIDASDTSPMPEVGTRVP